MPEQMMMMEPDGDESEEMEEGHNPCTVTSCIFNQDGRLCSLHARDVPVAMDNGRPVCTAYEPRTEPEGGMEEAAAEAMAGPMMGPGMMPGGPMPGPMPGPAPRRRRVPPPPM